MPPPNERQMIGLHTAREEHDAAWCSDGRWWQILPELGTNNTTGTMRSTDLAPHHTEATSILLGFGAVHVHDLLAKVELHIESSTPWILIRLVWLFWLVSAL